MTFPLRNDRASSARIRVRYPETDTMGVGFDDRPRRLPLLVRRVFE